MSAGEVLARNTAPGADRAGFRIAVIGAMTSRSGSDGHVRKLLGVYLMGGLPEDDAAAVRAHLAVCAMCKAEHDDLAPVPGWLSLLSDEQIPPRLTVARDPDADPDRGKPKGRGRRPPGPR
jgi:anti-sigma factor RsiW